MKMSKAKWPAVAGICAAGVALLAGRRPSRIGAARARGNHTLQESALAGDGQHHLVP